jgi:hypothetical protein
MAKQFSEIQLGREMGKLNTASNWTLAAVYGGTAIAMVNPVAGVLVAAACYIVKTKLQEQERTERKARSEAEQNRFRERFYNRQNFSCYADYLVSDTWRSKREAIHERANGLCERPGCTSPLNEVHHMWYPRVWGEEPLTALIGLCREHHDHEHKTKS